MESIGRLSILCTDGDVVILIYRGYPIEELAVKSSLLEVAYLLSKSYQQLEDVEAMGYLPNSSQFCFAIPLVVGYLSPSSDDPDMKIMGPQQNLYENSLCRTVILSGNKLKKSTTETSTLSLHTPNSLQRQRPAFRRPRTVDSHHGRRS
ncbi:Citrate synthase [Dillenia turbinata]|uniref:Citrate synthase n=1 Tax=Dillenia turbinata TaxID=194707 RepID=A0AAN8W1I7_9MAGN